MSVEPQSNSISKDKRAGRKPHPPVDLKRISTAVREILLALGEDFPAFGLEDFGEVLDVGILERLVDPRADAFLLPETGIGTNAQDDQGRDKISKTRTHFSGTFLREDDFAGYSIPSGTGVRKSDFGL